MVAKRDQAFAELFYRSGWTQEQLAEREGKSTSWVSCRLRLGRVLAYVMNSTDLEISLTGGRFRGFLEKTDKTDEDNTRFDAVIRRMRRSTSTTPQPRLMSLMLGYLQTHCLFAVTF